jgi:CRP/FNR family cyclic AMP-dependent transcriptional regulator
MGPATRSILKYCAASGAPERKLVPGTLLLSEGQTSGRLYVLAAGTIAVSRGDTVVSVVDEPGSVFGEMSALIDKPHSATVRAETAATVFEFEDAAAFLRSHTDIAFAVAQLLARRLSAATSYLVDIKHQFQDRSDHLGMVGEVLDSLVHHHHAEIGRGSDRELDPPY